MRLSIGGRSLPHASMELVDCWVWWRSSYGPHKLGDGTYERWYRIGPLYVVVLTVAP